MAGATSVDSPRVITRNFTPGLPLLSVRQALLFAMRGTMARLYFHCHSTEGALIDNRGTAVANLTEAHERAAHIAQTLIMTPNLEDWRDWVVHVEDQLGDEVFAVPFASMLGKAN